MSFGLESHFFFFGKAIYLKYSRTGIMPCIGIRFAFCTWSTLRVQDQQISKLSQLNSSCVFYPEIFCNGLADGYTRMKLVEIIIK